MIRGERIRTLAEREGFEPSVLETSTPDFEHGTRILRGRSSQVSARRGCRFGGRFGMVCGGIFRTESQNHNQRNPCPSSLAIQPVRGNISAQVGVGWCGFRRDHSRRKEQ